MIRAYTLNFKISNSDKAYAKDSFFLKESDYFLIIENNHRLDTKAKIITIRNNLRLSDSERLALVTEIQDITILLKKQAYYKTLLAKVKNEWQKIRPYDFTKNAQKIYDWQCHKRPLANKFKQCEVKAIFDQAIRTNLTKILKKYKKEADLSIETRKAFIKSWKQQKTAYDFLNFLIFYGFHNWWMSKFFIAFYEENSHLLKQKSEYSNYKLLQKTTTKIKPVYFLYTIGIKLPFNTL